MNRFNRKFTILALLGVVMLLTLYSPSVRALFLALGSTIRSTYLELSGSIEKSIEKHFFQAKKIEDLERDKIELQKELLQHRSGAAMYRYIRGALKMGPDTNATYEALRPEGYAMIGNFQQLWLDSFKNFNPAKNYGVIRDGYAVGIVVEKDLRPLLILAGDPECTFAVYIGEVRAPGIATGMDERHMVVKYIPQWLKLKKGDTVLTSGLDKIFPPGIPVGRVVSTQKMQGFQNAYIELYGDTLHPDLVWVVSPDKTSTESDS